MSSGTARLKRRLDEQGINYTNKRAVENFCLVRFFCPVCRQNIQQTVVNRPLSFVQIGTPLPPLEKKDANEFVPVWKQEVCPTDLPFSLTPFLERATTIRFAMRRAVDDYTAPSPVASLPDTSTPLGRKRVRAFFIITTRSPYTIPKRVHRMDPIDIRLLSGGPRQAEGLPSRRLHGRGGSRRAQREPDHERCKGAATARRICGHGAS